MIKYLMIKKYLKSLVPKEFIWALLDIIKPNVFGQLGEDAVIENHLSWLGLDINKKGMYVDIGAFHPTRGSNTFKFYKKGSMGYAIDVGKKKKRLWKILRPRDIFINTAVVNNSYKEEFVDFIMRDGYGAMTDYVKKRGVIKETIYHRKNMTKIKATKANEICNIITNDSRWSIAPWKFITIDIEGMDEFFIKDLDLKKLAPDVLAIEYFIPKQISYLDKIKYLSNCDLILNLKTKGYALQSICGPTLILVRVQSKDLILRR